MPVEALRRRLSPSRARLVAGRTEVAEWWTLLGCLLVVALPALTIAVGSLVARPDLHPGGDQAVIEIGTGNAAKLDQGLGPYSRFGWSHPGPSWYYLLAPLYRLLGEHSWAMTVAVAAVHAAAAAAIVLAVRCFGARRLFVVAAAAVLLYVTSLPGEEWRAVWNPYALLLPAGLLLVLCAGAAAGSRLAPVGALLCGSFLIQTHIGTAPLVVAMWGASAALTVVFVRRRRICGSCDGSVGGFRLRRGRAVVGTARRGRAWRELRGPRVSGPEGDVGQEPQFRIHALHPGIRQSVGIASQTQFW
jgi:hypothetical protein